MDSIRILGYANSEPTVFVVDLAYPHSLVSASSLFRNSLHAKLDSTGCNYAHLMILVPTWEGVVLHFIKHPTWILSDMFCQHHSWCRLAGFMSNHYRSQFYMAAGRGEDRGSPKWTRLDSGWYVVV